MGGMREIFYEDNGTELESHVLDLRITVKASEKSWDHCCSFAQKNSTSME